MQQPRQGTLQGPVTTSWYAQVVLFLGELDCREHLAALQDPKALSAQAGQRVDVLLSLALGLIRARGFRIALHPALPLLPASMAAVQAFNAQLACKVGPVSVTECESFSSGLVRLAAACVPWHRCIAGWQAGGGVHGPQPCLRAEGQPAACACCIPGAVQTLGRPACSSVNSMWYPA